MNNQKCKLRSHRTYRLPSHMAHTLSVESRVRDMTESEFVRKIIESFLGAKL
jgi:hypothetical protein